MKNRTPSRAIKLLTLFALSLVSLNTLAQEKNLVPVSKREFKHKEKIVTKYDRFKDETMVSLPRMKIHDRNIYLGGQVIVLATAFTHAGQTPTMPDRVILAFTYSSANWQFSSGGEVLVILDGERLSLGRLPRVESDVYSGVLSGSVLVSETIAGFVPYETFLKITNARVVEMKVGRAEFQLKDNHMEALRDLASRVAR